MNVFYCKKKTPNIRIKDIEANLVRIVLKKLLARVTCAIQKCTGTRVVCSGGRVVPEATANTEPGATTVATFSQAAVGRRTRQSLPVCTVSLSLDEVEQGSPLVEERAQICEGKRISLKSVSPVPVWKRFPEWNSDHSIWWLYSRRVSSGLLGGHSLP